MNKVRLAESMFGGFVLCPHDGRTLAYLPGDDKVTCFCPQSNGGVHRVAGMSQSSAERWWTEAMVRRSELHEAVVVGETYKCTKIGDADGTA